MLKNVKDVIYLGKGKILNQIENKTWLIWKMAIASALSWEAAKILGSHHPYLAPISVIFCMQSTINQSIRFSFHKITGTVIGILITTFAAPFLRVNGWTIGLLIFAGGIISKWLKREESALHHTALTVLLIFIFEQKPGSYPIDRFREILIGAIIAVLIHMMIKSAKFYETSSSTF
ncbi:MAG: aromatic acid exporter family protein [Bacillota bacterium]|nr:aromatic acid exporter family protein [Bacillota bacterium]